MAGVRLWVNAQVRGTSASQNVVVDGRDIGTVVFPDASLKVFLDRRPVGAGEAPPDSATWAASERGRDRRRKPTCIVHRDAKDATQTVQASDAVLIDTTYLTQEDQVERIVALARAASQRSDDETDAGVVCG